ncbi:hypothetical protein DFR52_102686 [Hoeflea marina]|uniref:Uncharacterized protein n=1 Tax=Hoeflea marina TaxID=274592 RepID=A0A317PP44_9HYPH|nr:hypothetical protein [Hoeflea marina]PWW02021.1 hypothetical protein DFR52_102686 [Hoeflea marina]
MQSLAAVMLVVSCTQVPEKCTEIPVPVPAYETMAACMDDLRPMMGQADVRKGQIIGACASFDSALFERDAAIVWDVSAAGRLSVELEADSMAVASAETTVLQR